jgi:polysaccharide chain length determinant protein (PEP-CTERM system associated)
MLDIEDYVDILRRHRAWILGPMFLGLVVGVVVAFLWPDSYLASGLIRVVPPQVPEGLVPSNLSEGTNQRINRIYQEIIGRTFLTNLMQTYNLYPDERKRLPNEDVLEMMRKEIMLGQMRYLSRGAGSLTEGVNAFSVSYSYSDRRLAQKVCQDIITKFIDESTKTRSTQSVLTTEFFRDQYEVAKRDLEEVEKKIAAFQMQNSGELPEQAQSNIARVAGLEAGIQSASGAISRANQDKLQMETQLRLLHEQANAITPTSTEQVTVTAARNDRLAELDRELARMQAVIADLRESYKDTHPDVRRATAYLAMKQKEREQLVQEVESTKAENASKPKVVVMPNPSAQKDLREINASIARLQSAMQAKDVEIDDLNRQLRDNQARLKRLQAQMETSPVAQQQYLQLVRDRDLIKQRYGEINTKMERSSMATDLENRRQGESLEVLETPVIPEAPYAPKRPMIIVVGFVVGLATGMTLAGAREIKDTSLKNLKDVRAYTKLTVLGSIPFLENDFIVRRRRRMAWLAWTAVFLVGVLMMTGSVIYYFTSKT